MFILFEYYHARQFYFECWKFTENSQIGKFSENVILARARARAGARMIKSKKYEPSAFTGKKLINLDKNLRFQRNSKVGNSIFFELFSKNDMFSQNANKICIKMTQLFSKKSQYFYKFSKQSKIIKNHLKLIIFFSRES